MSDPFPPYPSRGPRAPGSNPWPGAASTPGSDRPQSPNHSPFAPPPPPPPPPAQPRSKSRSTFAAFVGRHPRKSVAAAIAATALVFGAVNSADAEPDREPVGLMSTPTPVPSPTPTPTPTPSPTPTPTPTPSAIRTVAEQSSVATPSPANTGRQPFADTQSSTSRASTAPTRAQTQDSGGSAYYKNCTEVRAAGKAPLYRGQPGYASHLDRDNDGVACE